MFSYIGGKKFQAKWIANHFPKHDTYVEPFGGAFWVYLISNINANKNVYNDYNRYISNIFYCIKHHREEFYKELIPLTYQLELGNIETAATYIYLQTQTFSGSNLEKATFMDLKGKYKSKYEQFFEKLVNPKYIVKLNNISDVENLSYENCIKKYDSKNTLFYCDPPYFKMEDYYIKEFGRDEHLKLANTLKSIKGKFVLSYYDFPELSKWFPKSKFNWKQKEFNKSNSTKKSKASKGNEILILNY